MSIDDFDLCTPLEFEKIFENWQEGSVQRMRNGWEQTRLLAVCVLQPYSKQRLLPEDVMIFPWDGQVAATKPGADAPGVVAGNPAVKPQGTGAGAEGVAADREAERRHYEEVKKARGLK